MTLAALLPCFTLNWKASYQWRKDSQITDISETRLKKTQKTATNIQLENYDVEHIPTESANGAVLLYIKKATNHKLWPDLIIYEKRELESLLK